MQRSRARGLLFFKNILFTLEPVTTLFLCKLPLKPNRSRPKAPVLFLFISLPRTTAKSPRAGGLQNRPGPPQRPGFLFYKKIFIHCSRLIIIFRLVRFDKF